MTCYYPAGSPSMLVDAVTTFCFRVKFFLQCTTFGIRDDDPNVRNRVSGTGTEKMDAHAPSDLRKFSFF